MNEEQMIEALLMLNEDLADAKKRIKTLEKTVAEQHETMDMMIEMMGNLGK